MDEHGYFNFSLTCSHLRALAEAAKRVVVVVKESIPWIYGGYDEYIHISEVDYIVEDTEFPVPYLPLFTVYTSSNKRRRNDCRKYHRSRAN